MMQWDKYYGPDKSSAGPPCTNYDNIPRQHEQNTTGLEWKIFKLKENMPHKCMVFLGSGQKKVKLKWPAVPK